jgi:hypothetical protein
MKEVTGMAKETGVFRSVKALPGYVLEIETRTDTRIVFDFNSRLRTIRFGALEDVELFNTARTDGDSILFGEYGETKVKIEAPIFMDLVLVDRSKGDVPYYRR